MFYTLLCFWKTTAPGLQSFFFHSCTDHLCEMVLIAKSLVDGCCLTTLATDIIVLMSGTAQCKYPISTVQHNIRYTLKNIQYSYALPKCKIRRRKIVSTALAEFKKEKSYYCIRLNCMVFGFEYLVDNNCIIIHFISSNFALCNKWTRPILQDLNV